MLAPLRSGDLNLRKYREDYGFLNEIKEQELEQINKYAPTLFFLLLAPGLFKPCSNVFSSSSPPPLPLPSRRDLKVEKDEDRREQLRAVSNRYTSQLRRVREQDEKERLAREYMASEADRVAQGKKPFFLGASQMRALGAASRFAALDAQGKVDKVLATRRKKAAGKDGRFMSTGPGARDDDGHGE